jgi:hypothetical protein
MGFVSDGARVAPAAMELAGQFVLKSVNTGSGVVTVGRVTNELVNMMKKRFRRRKFARHLTDIYNCENHQSQKEKSLEKMWGEVKDLTAEVFHKKSRISGIPKDHLFQELFMIVKGYEKFGFTLLNLETANTSAQDAAQISLM